MKKLILTAFEPFGDHDINPTMDIMKSIPDSVNRLLIIKMILPVVYFRCFDRVKKVIDKEKPDYVMSLGLAGGRSKISIERIAVNMLSASIADNEGTMYHGKLISETGKVGYFSTLPVERLKQVEESVDYSYSAGTYLCNNLFYQLMEYIDTNSLPIKGGFIHVPYTEHFNKQPFITLSEQCDIIIKMIEILGEDHG